MSLGLDSISLNVQRTWKLSIQNENNVVLNENSVEGKPGINRECNSNELIIKVYSCYDIKMKLLAVVTPPYIYHGCSTWKTFWEETFTGKKFLFLAVNMKNYGHCNIRKHKEIKGSEEYVTLVISWKFNSLKKTKITSSESKRKFGKIRKGVDYFSGFQRQSKAAKIQKGKVWHQNVSKRDLSKIIKEIKKIKKLPHEKKRPKHEPNDSYFNLAI